MTKQGNFLLTVLAIVPSNAFAFIVSPTTFRRPDPIWQMREAKANGASSLPTFDDNFPLGILRSGTTSGTDPTAILEQQMQDLAREWKSAPSQSYRQAIALQEAQLQRDIQALTSQLAVADSRRLYDAQIQSEMRSETEALRNELSSRNNETTKYRELYTQEKEARQEESKEFRSEIERLQEEVKVVFSIGRRTSDKIVKDLKIKLVHKEERLQMALEQVEQKEVIIQQLQQDRQSLRKLWRLSWRLAAQRMRHSIGGFLRNKLWGKPLPAIEERPAASTRKAVAVQRTRKRQLRDRE